MSLEPRKVYQILGMIGSSPSVDAGTATEVLKEIVVETKDYNAFLSDLEKAGLVMSSGSTKSITLDAARLLAVMYTAGDPAPSPYGDLNDFARQIKANIFNKSSVSTNWMEIYSIREKINENLTENAPKKRYKSLGEKFRARQQVLKEKGKDISQPGDILRKIKDITGEVPLHLEDFALDNFSSDQLNRVVAQANPDEFDEQEAIEREESQDFIRRFVTDPEEIESIRQQQEAWVRKHQDKSRPKESDIYGRVYRGVRSLIGDPVRPPNIQPPSEKYFIPTLKKTLNEFTDVNIFGKNVCIERVVGNSVKRKRELVERLKGLFLQSNPVKRSKVLAFFDPDKKVSGGLDELEDRLRDIINYDIKSPDSISSLVNDGPHFGYNRPKRDDRMNDFNESLKHYRLSNYNDQFDNVIAQIKYFTDITSEASNNSQNFIKFTQIFSKPANYKISDVILDKEEVFMHKKADKFSKQYFKDAIVGLDDAYAKSYFAGLKSMYDKKPKRTKADYKKLYELHDENGPELIGSAHPYTIDIADAMGNGGIVENQIEQQRANIGVANSVPSGNFRGRHAWVIQNLVKLAESADQKGDLKVSDLIDAALEELRKL